MIIKQIQILHYLITTLIFIITEQQYQFYKNLAIQREISDKFLSQIKSIFSQSENLSFLLTNIQFTYSSDNSHYTSKFLQHLGMRVLQFAGLFILLVMQASCGHVFLAYTLQNTSYYQCFLKAGNPNIIIDIVEQNNAISQTSIQNGNNAKNAGLQVDIVLSVCRNRTIDQSVQVIKTAFPDKIFERVWLHIPTNETTRACGWQNYPPTQNCQYLQDLISKIQQNLKASTGIYSARAKWYEAFKSYQGCPAVSNSPLWFVPEKIPEQPNFNDYKQMGGWSSPTLKIFNFATVCGVTVFDNYYK